MHNTKKQGGDLSMTKTDDKKGIVTIHGKEYMTVARRVELWHEDMKNKNTAYSIRSEVLSHDPVVVRTTVKIGEIEFTGISSVDLSSAKVIEKQNPYEVAETSAVGRALGFAGYGLIESVASADEMVRATTPTARVEGGLTYEKTDEAVGEPVKPVAPSGSATVQETTCELCGKPAVERKGVTKGGKNYHGIFCSTEERSHTRWLWN